MSVLLGSLGIFVSFAILIGVPSYFYEKKRYNNGFCSCGSRWIHFDCDSQGGDMFKCDNCGAYLDTSWIRPKNVYYGKVK
jgi:hypothetical protein